MNAQEIKAQPRIYNFIFYHVFIVCGVIHDLLKPMTMMDLPVKHKLLSDNILI